MACSTRSRCVRNDEHADAQSEAAAEQGAGQMDALAGVDAFASQRRLSVVERRRVAGEGRRRQAEGKE